ncbi:MAG: glutamine--fructose-6-phosphate transaminase (isomerizing) [Selenomonas sp.]|uniref:glutamine--fructose-6-phosphate transaminase (isomerizing) n=1 Tax=Selenomonas sp. AE3005 TaxID=1485543 RepID=UPI00047F9697|nr:glutamine--fructose-6-phosphate transaminase (isomerizing) [Selenomonas sp. AE3005]MBQ1416488.1 glutamine--fructose-6-phosphate transaminase (isomerizing) [Selenomonas sp.]MBQ2137698.1 glutamine--fructose-6-phosphate transaminase (isomerizing) [Selenomonas sp.]MBQ4213293.1 glutamine--fructose-6-phosphate transaminase (isomerizing) [Selenomonas sp.]
MCGIVGYVGDKEAAGFLVEGLAKLEYRGYDSAGIAVFDGAKIGVEKSVGRLAALRDKLKSHELKGTMGIGHTRWATHGRPSDVNSHPHTDCSGDFVVVHNGIIENYLTLKEELIENGHSFKSETDTEVVAHLIEEVYNGDFVASVREVLRRVEGSYSLVFMSSKHPGTLIATKQDNPLVIGVGEGENFIASDIPAIIQRTRRTYILNDGELAVITKDSIKISNRQGEPVTKKIFEVNWNAEAAEKGGYEHFMLKEIHEQPKAVRDTMSQRIAKDGKTIVMDELKWDADYLNSFNKIYIVACGTAYHAGMVGKYYIEKLARTVVEVDVASEFRYREPIVDENTLFIAVSQSGETSDTLAAMKESKRLGAKTLAITNVVGSSIAREADQVLYTWAGPEIAVASTKAYTTQIVLFFMLALYMAEIKKTVAPERVAELIAQLQKIPAQISETLSDVEPLKTFAKRYGFNDDVFYIGRGLDYHVALEGSLKLKEISYIHAEAYAAGELKHGTLALIVEGVPVIALATQKSVYEKTLSNIKEVKARDAVVIGIATEGDEELEKYVDHVMKVPETDELVIPILTVVPLQLLAYYAAITRGCDVDKPRNLAKSVTVE